MSPAIQAMAVPGSESAMFVARKSEHDTSTDLQQSTYTASIVLKTFPYNASLLPVPDLALCPSHLLLARI